MINNYIRYFIKIIIKMFEFNKAIFIDNFYTMTLIKLIIENIF